MYEDEDGDDDDEIFIPSAQGAKPGASSVHWDEEERTTASLVVCMDIQTWISLACIACPLGAAGGSPPALGYQLLPGSPHCRQRRTASSPHWLKGPTAVDVTPLNVSSLLSAYQAELCEDMDTKPDLDVWEEIIVITDSFLRVERCAVQAMGKSIGMMEVQERAR